MYKVTVELQIWLFSLLLLYANLCCSCLFFLRVSNIVFAVIVRVLEEMVKSDSCNLHYF